MYPIWYFYIINISYFVTWKIANNLKNYIDFKQLDEENITN